jgi:hypothetical protein
LVRTRLIQVEVSLQFAEKMGPSLALYLRER